MDPLGDRIRRAREAAGLSQAELAARIGRHEKTVRNWENGHATPANSIGRLEAVLGVDLSAEVAERLADRTSPRLTEATDAQVVANLTARLAERNETIRRLTIELAEYRATTDTADDSPAPARWAARIREAPDAQE